eukprot:2843762-Rhodomonas_salina.1
MESGVLIVRRAAVRIICAFFNSWGFVPVVERGLRSDRVMASLSQYSQKLKTILSVLTGTTMVFRESRTTLGCKTASLRCNSVSGLVLMLPTRHARLWPRGFGRFSLYGHVDKGCAQKDIVAVKTL